MEPLQYEERGYLKEPFRLFHLADGRGEYIEYHYHTFHKIIILLAGKAGYAVEGERYDLSPGDFVLVGSGSIHRPIVEAGDYYERMILYIAPEYLRSLAQGDCDPEECFRRAQETFQYVFRDEGTSRVRVLFQSLAETVRQHGCMNMIHNCGQRIYFDAQIEAVDPVAISFLYPPDDCADYAECKAKYGDRVALIGAVTPANAVIGTDEEWDEQCRSQIDAMAGGGGFMLATGCEYPANATFDRAQRMIDIAKTYGAYRK